MRMLPTTRSKTLRVICSMLLALTIAMASQVDASIIIVGGAVNNGDFNAGGGTGTQTFAETPSWENIGTGDQTDTATNTNIDNDGTRNAIVTEAAVRAFGLDTAYSIVTGDVFDISYVWQDASGWIDGSDQVQVSLFVTADNTIGGTRTNLVQSVSGLSTLNSTYEAVDQDAVYVAVLADAGKRLFVEIDALDGAGGASGFARLDDFVLEVTSAVPEPSTLALGTLTLVGLGVCRRRRRV